jgi:hypothetical protein
MDPKAQTTRKRKSVTAEQHRQLIAKRAFEIWLNEGRPQGHAIKNWRQAEQEINSKTASVVIQKAA